MNWIVNAVKDNPEVFAALVAFCAIFGGIAGSYIGGRVQAAGGQAQASAAKDAARIMVEYQHLASLHTDRRVVVAAFIHAAKDAKRSIDRSFSEEGTGEQQALAELTVKEAELEIIAPDPVVAAVAEVKSAIEDFRYLALLRATESRALNHLIRGAQFGTPGWDAMERAVAALKEFREACARTSDETEREPYRTSARAALNAVQHLNAGRVELLMLDGAQPELSPLRVSHKEAIDRAMASLIREARAMLRSDEVH